MAAAALLFVQTLSLQGDEAAPMVTLEAARQEVATIPEATAPDIARGVAEAEEPAVALLDTDEPVEELASAQYRRPSRTTAAPEAGGDVGTFDQTAAAAPGPTTPKPKARVVAAPPSTDYDAVADGYEDLELDAGGLLGAETGLAAGRSAEQTLGGGAGQPVGGVAGVSATTRSASAPPEVMSKDMEDILSDEREVSVAKSREFAPVDAPDRDQNEAAVATLDRVRGDQAPVAAPPPAPDPAEPVVYDHGAVADADDHEEEEEAEHAAMPASEEVVFMERKGPRISIGRKRESSRRPRAPKGADASEVGTPVEVPVSSEPVPIPEAEPETEAAREEAFEPAPEVAFGRDKAPTDDDARLDELRAQAIPSELSEEALMRWTPAAPAANAQAIELAEDGEYQRAADALQATLDVPAPDGQYYAAQAANYRLRAGEVEQANEAAVHGLAISGANTPERAWLLVLYGDALRASGEYDRAAQVYQQAIALNLGRANHPARARPSQEP